MEKAKSAIATASRLYKPGIQRVNLGTGKSLKVGSPATNIPDIQCQDFMSPSDCNKIFNVCDPVVCPSSRCDLGGTYPVKDVIRSGVIGSLALCSQNFPEVKIPVCLTGVHAGLEGYLSVLNSYQDCLETSLETGQTVGICDEIYSVHMCEFFWRQSLPLAKIAIPKLLGKVLGQDVRGGGEYLGVQDAWDKMGDSFNFFTQYYAANSFQAFKARSTESIGSELCKNYVSAVLPQGGNLLDSLTTPDSPPQFHGKFDEIPFTTATNPPTSHYKVFYHVYAGKDLPVYYQVYLKGTGSSFYQDTSYRRIVANGFIAAGEYYTETKDFTAPSGYQEMCIVVNGQEECGFKQVTTAFAVNYLTEKYIATQASETDITSELQCVSGTPNINPLTNPSFLLNPNLEAGISEALDPAIYNRGITRICATDNPGKGTDPDSNTNNSRWVDVGYCGAKNMKCWLDTQSVRSTIRSTTIEDEILGEVSDNYLEVLMDEGGFMDKDKFKTLVDEIEDMANPNDRLVKVHDNYDRAFYNHEKGKLVLLKAEAYSELAVEAKEDEKSPAASSDSDDSAGSGGPYTTCASQKTCKTELGIKVLQRVNKEKRQYTKVDFDTVEKQTEISSFECLVLMVSRIESNIQHCKEGYPENKGDPLYCEGDMGKLNINAKDEDSRGIMQINLDVHQERLDNEDIDISYFEQNVDYGIRVLMEEYMESEPRTYECNGKKTYDGWLYALRGYNGWTTNCDVGNTKYVEMVLGEIKADVEKDFPEFCGRGVDIDAALAALSQSDEEEEEPGFETRSALEGRDFGNSRTLFEDIKVGSFVNVPGTDYFIELVEIQLDASRETATLGKGITSVFKIYEKGNEAPLTCVGRFGIDKVIGGPIDKARQVFRDTFSFWTKTPDVPVKPWGIDSELTVMGDDTGLSEYKTCPGIPGISVRGISYNSERNRVAFMTQLN